MATVNAFSKSLQNAFGSFFPKKTSLQDTAAAANTASTTPDASVDKAKENKKHNRSRSQPEFEMQAWTPATRSTELQ